MPQAILTGKSMPKVVRVNASDDDAVVYKNLGDGQRLPFLWAKKVTGISGTDSVVVADGVKFGDQKACNGHVIVSPLGAVAAALDFYIDKDTATNVVTLVFGGTIRQTLYFDVYIYIGDGVNYDSTDKIQIWKNP